MTANIENDSLLPSSIKSLLANPRLKGLHGTFGSKIDVKETYTLAIDTILGAMQNVVICDDEVAAKTAIKYLKDNRLGRVTFFPLNVIKSKYVDEMTMSLLDREDGFIGIASTLVDYDTKYKNIVENLLGNVIVVENIDAMNRIGKLIHYTYRVVSLDGEVLHTGGSVTGGTVKTIKNTLTEKNNIKLLASEIETLKADIDRNNERLEDLKKEEELLVKNVGENRRRIVRSRRASKK